jgi:hypothetical protein
MHKLINQTRPKEMDDNSPYLYLKVLSLNNTKVNWEGRVYSAEISTKTLNALFVTDLGAQDISGSKFIAFYKQYEITVTPAGLILQSLGQIRYVNRISTNNKEINVDIVPGTMTVTDENTTTVEQRYL